VGRPMTKLKTEQEYAQEAMDKVVHDEMLKYYRENYTLVKGKLIRKKRRAIHNTHIKNRI
jgi:hypothetical protein